jgi:hypothetical protein
MKWLVACEFSGRIRRALQAMGHKAWSCDIRPAEDGADLWHYQDDIRVVLEKHAHKFDGMIAHPVCTYLTNSGVRWLHEADDSTPGQLKGAPRWAAMEDAVDFYLTLRNAPIPRKAIENPVMHRYAIERIRPGVRQVVQPWWFGDPFFKATGLELINLPKLIPTNKLTPPKTGTEEHKAWSAVHREPPGPDREKNRSRTFPGMAAAMAAQWGAL